MKLIYIFILLISNTALAMESATSVTTQPTVQKYIHEGNIEVSGGFSINAGPGSTSLQLYPAAGYFIADGLLLGTYFNFSFTKATDSATSYGLGPYLSYFFWEGDKWAGAVSQYFDISQFFESSFNGRASTYVGAKYFIEPNVALALDLGLSYAIGPLKFDNRTIELLGRYNIYF